MTTLRACSHFAERAVYTRLFHACTLALDSHANTLALAGHAGHIHKGRRRRCRCRCRCCCSRILRDVVEQTSAPPRFQVEGNKILWRTARRVRVIDGPHRWSAAGWRGGDWTGARLLRRRLFVARSILGRCSDSNGSGISICRRRAVDAIASDGGLVVIVPRLRHRRHNRTPRVVQELHDLLVLRQQNAIAIAVEDAAMLVRLMRLSLAAVAVPMAGGSAVVVVVLLVVRILCVVLAPI